MPKALDETLVFEADCAPRRVMELFAVKWVSMVLHALDRWPGGRCRTGQLQRALPGISKKMPKRCWCRPCATWKCAA